MNIDIEKQIINLAEEYDKGLITHSEIQDVLMGIEHIQGIEYEELYKAFANRLQKYDKKW